VHFGLPSHPLKNSGFAVPKYLAQITAAGTVTELNSIPLHQFSNVKVECFSNKDFKVLNKVIKKI